MEIWEIILFGGVGYCCWMVKDNHEAIVEERRNKRLAEIELEEKRLRKKDPKRYGQFNLPGRLVDLSTQWKDIYI